MLVLSFRFCTGSGLMMPRPHWIWLFDMESYSGPAVGTAWAKKESGMAKKNSENGLPKIRKCLLPSLRKSSSVRQSDLERAKISVQGRVRALHHEVEFLPFIISAVNFTMGGDLPDGVPISKMAEQTTAVLKGSIDLLKAVKTGQMDQIVYAGKGADR